MKIAKTKNRTLVRIASSFDILPLEEFAEESDSIPFPQELCACDRRPFSFSRSYEFQARRSMAYEQENLAAFLAGLVRIK